MNQTQTANATAQSINAARSCINAGELVRDVVPQSHYLAICVHYLTLSGVALFRMPGFSPDSQAVSDAERCVGFLKDLDTRWSGALRSRAIIFCLLEEFRGRERTGSVVAAGPRDAQASGHEGGSADLEGMTMIQSPETIWPDLLWNIY